MGILDDLQLTRDELEELLQQNPSMRGLFVGYIAEKRLCDIWFPGQDLHKYDDHDRRKKGDRWIMHRGHELSIEVKSLQSNSVEKTEKGWKGRFQCDASDRRKVTLPTGGILETTCLVVGEFDMLAINLFEFGRKWHFAFARNVDLPRSKGHKYTAEQKQHLLQTTPRIELPLSPPYYDDPFVVLDKIVESKTH